MGEPAILVTGAMNGAAGSAVWCVAAAATGRSWRSCATARSPPS
jgi:hypothetical protein